MAEFDLDALLADILDESKPLPQAEPAIITPAPGFIYKATVVEELTRVNQPEEEITFTDKLEDLFPTQVGQFDAFPESLPAAPEPSEEPPAEKGDYSLPELTLPTFTTSEIAEALDLRNFATLTILNTARWHAKVKDRKASRDVANANNADAAAFETHKRLLAGADEKLKAIYQTIDGARAKYYELTLPWSTTRADDVGRRQGARMLPNSTFFDFIGEMAKFKAQMTAALDEFEPAYPALVQQAQKMLGDRFDISEYPPAESIRKHFDLSFDFHPIPEGSDFKGLPAQQTAALARAIEGKTEKMLENAMQDLWQRAYAAIGRMEERLSHPDRKFHGTLVDNVRKVASQLKHLNVTNDKRVTELQEFIEARLCKHEAKDLREKPTLRMQVYADACEAVAMMRRAGK